MKEEKKVIQKVTVFPVSFNFEISKENLSITTEANTCISKSKLIKQALKLHSVGQISQARKCYREIISQGFKDPRIFSNYGTILKGVGKLKEAELFTRKAIDISPEYAHAYYHLGSILSDLGRLKEAELSTRQAIKLNPKLADAYSNLGVILIDLGNLKEAEISLRKAIEIDPKLTSSRLNLARIESDKGKNQEAFDLYTSVIDINKENAHVYPLITQFLKYTKIPELNEKKLKVVLELLLKRNDIPHTYLFRVFIYIYRNQLLKNKEEINSKYLDMKLLMNDEIIINSLKKIIFKDMSIEKLFTKIRERICIEIAENKKNYSDSQLQFVIALAEQCFLNEYVYASTEKEDKSINCIIERCKKGELNETYISIICCYFPLYKLNNTIPSLKLFYSSKKNFQELIKLQLLEPLEEIKLSHNIKRLGSIKDNISQKVKAQYEENPYPRWRYGANLVKQKVSITQAINAEIRPNIISCNSEDRKRRILIAGCGTGNQILQAQRYNNALITGIDISSKSLAYAQRKINELGFNNVELIQIDILEAGLIREKFDIIECSGVLHHMSDPIKGLNSLVSTLKKNGFIKLGLYSELARTDIIQARKYISNHNIEANIKGIKDFREDVFSNKNIQISKLKNWANFYTISECRDLCFHEKEHRFTANQIEKILLNNQLKFLGFLLPKQIKLYYEKYFPEDKEQTNLQNWVKFEEKFPNTFKGMYQFWLSK